MLAWGLEFTFFRFLNLSYFKYYSILFALFRYYPAHTYAHLETKQKNQSIAIIYFSWGQTSCFFFLTPVIWIVLIQDWYYEIADKNKGPLFHFFDMFSGRQLYMRLTFSMFCRMIGWLPPLSPFTTSASCEKSGWIGEPIKYGILKRLLQQCWRLQAILDCNGY